MINWTNTHVEELPTGEKIKVRVGTPLKDFWVNWKINSDRLKDQGYELFKLQNNWYVKKRLIILNAPALNVTNKRYNNHSLLLDYQQSHYNNLLNAFNNGTGVIDASDTGTGKTPVACAIVDKLKTQFAVICPLAVIPTWIKWCKHFKINPIFIANYESFKNRGNKYGYIDIKYYPNKILSFLKIPFKLNAIARSFNECVKMLDNNAYIKRNYSYSIKQMIDIWERKFERKFPRKKCRVILNFKWNLPKNALIIFDESHYCKSEYTQNTKMLIAAKKYKTLLLSATIAENPTDMRGIGYILGLHNLYNFQTWLRGNDCLQDAFNGWKCDNPIESMKNLNKQIFPARGSRMRIKDIPNFPKNKLIIESYKNKVADKFNREYKKLLERVNILEMEGATRFEILVKIQKFRQVAELIKTPLYVALAKESINKNLSVIIAVNFTETREAIQTALKCDCAVFGVNSKGKHQTASERQKCITDFYNNKSKIIVIMSSAGGLGISLHDEVGGHQRVMIISPSYNSRQFKQVLGRGHRAGAKSITIQRVVYLHDTIEAKVCESVNRKLDNISALNDGDVMEKDLFKFKGD